MIRQLLGNRKKKAIRNMMRGYRILKKESQLDLILKIKEDIAAQDLGYVIKGANSFLWGDTKGKADQVLKQFLVSRLGNNRLNAAILIAISDESRKISCAIPPNWIPIFKNYNLPVDRVASLLKFMGFLIKMVVSSYFFSIKFVFKSILTSNDFESEIVSVYFDGLSDNNLPNGKKISYDIISWYLKWEGHQKNLSHIFHNLKNREKMIYNQINLIGTEFPTQYYRYINSYWKFAKWFLLSVGLTFAEFLRGNWWNLALLQEAAKAAALRFQVRELIANQYFFHNSNWIYRPLWTYEAEKKGAKISFYFYSTNCESFKRSGGYPVQANCWQLMSWPHFMVWDNYQKEFVERAVGSRMEISIVGNIWFSSSSRKLNKLPSNSIVVFDVQPVRDSFYQTLGIDFEYYIPETACAFLADIYKAVSELNCSMILKRKRNINSLAHPTYRNFIENLSNLPNFTAVNAELAAQELIENCEVVISMPFTSTALIAREFGKNSIYYDPTKKLMKDDRAAHGIEIIQGIDELKIWLFETLRK